MFSRFWNEIKKGAGKADFDTKKKKKATDIRQKPVMKDQNSYGMML